MEQPREHHGGRLIPKRKTGLAPPSPVFSAECRERDFRAVSIKLWPCFARAPEKFREVLDCGSPLPLFPRQDWRRKSGRGLATHVISTQAGLNDRPFYFGLDCICPTHSCNLSA